MLLRKMLPALRSNRWGNICPSHLVQEPECWAPFSKPWVLSPTSDSPAATTRVACPIHLVKGTDILRCNGGESKIIFWSQFTLKSISESFCSIAVLTLFWHSISLACRVAWRSKMVSLLSKSWFRKFAFSWSICKIFSFSYAQCQRYESHNCD